MVAVNRLEIQGIRSFGPENEDMIRIDFSTPLTIITGQNGAGKTTIIESLRYATTGEFPPTSNRGKSFVCHPELTGSREVKAKLTLNFTTASGMTVLSVKRLEATNNNGAVSVKSLASHISKEVNGEMRTISSKCIDANVEILNLLGVSKAMLSDVIFCHQEDSHWPLAESDSVKKKFDEIFMLEKYVKALESLKSNKKALNLNLKPSKESKNYLQQTMDMVREKEGTQKRYEEEIDSGEKQMNEYTTKINELSEKSREISKIINEIKLVTEKIQMMNQRIEILEAKVPPACRALSLSDLNSFNKEITEKTSTYNREIDNLQQRQQVLNFELQNLRNSYLQLERKIGILEGEGLLLENQKVSLENDLNDLKTLMIHISPSSIQICSINNENIIIDLCEKLLKELELELTNMDKTDTLQERNLELKKQDQMKKHDRFEQGYKSQLVELSNTEINLNQMTGELSEIASLDQHGNLNQFEFNINNIMNELEHHKQKSDISKMETEMMQLEMEKGSLESEMEKLEIQAKTYEIHQNTRNRIEFKTQDGQRKRIEIQEMSNNINKQLSSLFTSIPPINKLLTQLKQLEEQKANEFNKYNHKLTDLNSQYLKIQANRKVIENQLANSHKKLIELKSKIREQCGTNELDVCLSEARQKKENFNDIFINEESSNTFSKLCLERFKTTNSCPACKRNFNSEKSRNDAVKSHENKVAQNPSDLISTYKQNLSQIEESISKLQLLSPTKDEVSLIEAETIPNLKKQFEKYQNDERKMKDQVVSCESKRDLHQNDTGLINRLLPECTVLAEKESEMSILEEQVAVETVKLGDFSISAYNTFKVKMARSQEMLKTITMDKEKRRILIDNERNERRILEDKLHELKTSRLEYASKFQKQDTLKNKKTELEVKIEELKNSIESTRKELGPSKYELEKIELDLKLCKEKSKTNQNEKKKLIDQLSRMLDGIQQKLTAYLELSQSCNFSTLDSLKTENNVNRIRIGSIEEEVTMNNDEINIKTREVQKWDVALTNYKDVQELYDLYETKEILENDKQKLTSINSNPNREHTIFTEQINEYRSKKDKQFGKISEKKASLRDIKRELDSKGFKDITKQYLKKTYEIAIIESMCQDIDYHYEELDRSMIRFHKEKIDQINDLLRSYWFSVYKGNDVDYIRITSNSEAGVTASGVRKYNYRVEMVKNDIGLDMRGRCSAGQKVLASILIRLALSQTFSFNCSIIALDEPTTNLDKENVISLAQALVKLSSTASRNKSRFQLILITHDQSFVSAFSQAEGVDHFWKLVKTGNFTSINRESFI